MPTELKSCPFCGSQPGEQDVGSYFVECPSCGLQGPAGTADGEASAVIAWNRRATNGEAMHVSEAQEPVARVDASDDGYFAEILPDRDVKVGQLLYTAASLPAPCPKCAEFALFPNADALRQCMLDTADENDVLRSKRDLLIIENDAQAVLISDQQTDVDKQTEISNNFAAQVGQQYETIASLRAEVDRLTQLVETAAFGIGKLGTTLDKERDTIAQQSERIAEFEKRGGQMAKRLKAYRQAWDAKDLHNQLSAIVFEEAHGVAFERAYSQQAALIGRCRRTLQSIAQQDRGCDISDCIVGPDNSVNPDPGKLKDGRYAIEAKEVLSAIAEYNKGGMNDE